ncbi:MAG TPA: TadE/TadG family type IV pilus assembly protein [Allosphingosinicella sp.]|nr:TadE/TadG family type IV pilus assembly protein [Allosphingosinicella sp.]
MARDDRGTSAIEFALIAPILAALAMGISDLSTGLARKYQLEQASYRVLELVSVGSLQSDYEHVKAEAAAEAGVPEANVDVSPWLECAGVKQSDFNAQCTGTDETARFLTVTVTDDFEPRFSYGPLGRAFDDNDDGKIRLTARSTIRIQ